MAGRLLTGLGIGATGSGWHEDLDALSGTAEATHAAADTAQSQAAAAAPALPPGGAAPGAGTSGP